MKRKGMFRFLTEAKCGAQTYSRVASLIHNVLVLKKKGMC